MAVPTGGGEITQWQFGTEDADLAVTLLVLRPSGGAFKIVSEDTQDLPHTPPANHLVRFTPPSPLAVQAGDTIGIYSDACVEYTGGAVPQPDGVVFTNSFNTTPPVGQDLFMDFYTENAKIALSATVVQPQDASVTTPSATDTTTGELVQLVSTVHNSGPATEPIDFTDSVPTGLAVRSVFANQARCARASGVVRCRFVGLGVGQRGRVAITVAANKAGSYVNHVSVKTTSGEPDPTPADNLATGRVSVRLAPCVVPSLSGAPIPVATQVLALLGCKVGTISHIYTRLVPKNAVVRTSPSAGTYIGGTRVAVTVSRGPRH